MASKDNHYDYVVVGAGVSALAFVDALTALRRDARVVVVDRRAHPGGHWNDAYPFVRLHLPSHMYGVNSRPFDRENERGVGVNRHVLHMATGSEVLSYCASVVEELQRGPANVAYLPHYEFCWRTSTARSLQTGEQLALLASTAVVDATYTDTGIPKYNVRGYAVAQGVNCIPIDALPAHLESADDYCVIGAGKTGIDACLWLIERGVIPDRIRWIVSRDAWWMRRERLQFSPEFAVQSLSTVADQMEGLSSAGSVDELFLDFERRGVACRSRGSRVPRAHCRDYSGVSKSRRRA